MHTAITTITPTTTSRIIAATTPPAIAPVLSGSAMAPSVVAVEDKLLGGDVYDEEVVAILVDNSEILVIDTVFALVLGLPDESVPAKDDLLPTVPSVVTVGEILLSIC